jgi:hypothetical protein
MTTYLVTLRGPRGGERAGAGRPAAPPITVEADDITYDTAGDTLIAVKFTRADGMVAAAFNGTDFVSAVAT